jgi:thiol-disulfide isomerase/thioredoxin
MADPEPTSSTLRQRREILLAASWLGINAMLPGQAHGQQPPDPPIFGTARSQFTLVRPRNKLAPLRLQDMNGKDAVLSPKPGNVTLVNLWATWCAACKLDLPTLAGLERLRRPRLDVWTICTDSRDLKVIRRFAQTVAMPRLAFADPYASASNPANAEASTFPLMAMPITYLIGTGGDVEGYITGAAEWLSPAGDTLLRYYLEQQG